MPKAQCESLKKCYHLQGFPLWREQLSAPLGVYLEKLTSAWVLPWCSEGERC